MHGKKWLAVIAVRLQSLNVSGLIALSKPEDELMAREGCRHLCDDSREKSEQI